MKALIQKILNGFGYQINKYPDLDVRRRIKIVHHYGIDTLIDVGANAGQYAMEMRKAGYKNKIISFEPIEKVFEQLLENSKNDPLWSAENYALGDSDRSETINISGHSLSSSILDMMPKHIEYAPNSEYISKEEIEVKRLDSIFTDISGGSQNIMLKIDTQGYEKQVIDGAKNTLNNLTLIQVEMSIIRLYDKEMLINEMIDYITKRNFRLISLENGFYDVKSGELLQVDGVFARNP